MLDEESSTTTEETAAGTAGSATENTPGSTDGPDTKAAEKPVKKAAKRATKKSAKKAPAEQPVAETTAEQAALELPADTAATPSGTSETGESEDKPAKKKAAKKTAKKTTKKSPSKAKAAGEPEAGAGDSAATEETAGEAGEQAEAASVLSMPLFQAPEPPASAPRKRSAKRARAETPESPESAESTEISDGGAEGGEAEGAEREEGATGRRRRSRGGRSRRRSGGEAEGTDEKEPTDKDGAGEKGSRKGKETEGGKEAEAEAEESASSHRRRRRRRSGDDSAAGPDEPAVTTTRVRQPRAKKETITSVEGSTRIEAKKQRRREGREAGRRRPPILSESEFLARRESVERVMVIRQRGEITQIAVLEDNVLVEHYVALESQSSLIGNVYLGRVQNVLPSMEAAFIDIGKGRNAVLYAGEVNWDLRDDKNQPRRIENALKPGQSVLVQVSKDPIGHKGARLTSQISLPGRYLVYVPGGGTSGISRKLPDTERNRLKNLLKEILPDDAGVIIRTAAEGASEEELTRDVNRLTARWDDIEKKSKNGQAPQLLYAEPDTTLKVVRDLFTEDFTKLVIAGADAWDMVDGYVQHVAPDLAERLEHYEGDGDVFANYRIDEQIAKALERKVWLPSGGSLVIDRTEAMTVVDVNTGKFTGSGGNLEETVTKNNLEAAEEIVRQLRLRDIGGIIVIDFIDMVLETNRDLVLRRLVECLGRDRTRHQVAEVTSLGLVQMTRKRISTGLLEAFSHPCEQCQGRGVTIEGEPVEPRRNDDHHHGGNNSRGGAKRSGGRRRGRRGGEEQQEGPETAESPESTESTEGTEGTGCHEESPVAASADGSGDGRETSITQPAAEAGHERPEGHEKATANGRAEAAPEPVGAAVSSSPASGAAGPPSGGENSPSTVEGGSGSSGSSGGASRGRRRRRASRPTGAPTPVSGQTSDS